MALVLSRKKGEAIDFVELGISITIDQIKGNRVSVAIEAPKGIKILRSELNEKPPEAKAS